MTIIIEILLISALCYLWYKIGYAKREEEFQNNPVTFIVGGTPAAQVYNSGPRTIITIYEKDLVEIRNNITNEFLDKHNPLNAIRALIPGFDEMSPADKVIAANAYTNKNRIKLVQEYNVSDDSDLRDSNAYGDGSEKEIK